MEFRKIAKNTGRVAGDVLCCSVPYLGMDYRRLMNNEKRPGDNRTNAGDWAVIALQTAYFAGPLIAPLVYYSDRIM